MNKPILINKLDNQKQESITFIPKTSFQCLMVGSIGASKTTTLINLLKNPLALAGRFNKIIIVSPTAKLDDKWKILYNHKIIVPNKELIKKLIKEQTKQKKQHPLNSVSLGHLPNDTVLNNEIISIDLTEPRALNDSDFIDEVDLSFLQSLLNSQAKIIKKFGKKYVDKILIVCDDCVSDRRTFRNPEVIKACLTSRHHEISTIYVSQAYHLVDKNIRLNCGFKIIYNIPNEIELKLIYTENTCDRNYQEFLIKFHEIVSKPYAFAVINYYNPPNYRLSNCFLEFM